MTVNLFFCFQPKIMLKLLMLVTIITIVNAQSGCFFKRDPLQPKPGEYYLDIEKILDCVKMKSTMCMHGFTDEKIVEVKFSDSYFWRNKYCRHHQRFGVLCQIWLLLPGRGKNFNFGWHSTSNQYSSRSTTKTNHCSDHYSDRRWQVYMIIGIVGFVVIIIILVTICICRCCCRQSGYSQI